MFCPFEKYRLLMNAFYMNLDVMLQTLFLRANLIFSLLARVGQCDQTIFLTMLGDTGLEYANNCLS